MTELIETGLSQFTGNLLGAYHASCSVSTVSGSLSHLEMAEMGVILHSPVPGISV